MNLWLDENPEANPALTDVEKEGARAVLALYNAGGIEVPDDRDQLFLMRMGRIIGALPVTMHRHTDDCGRA